MSTCSKSLAFTIGLPAPTAYWKFEALVGGQWLDSLNSLPITPVAGVIAGAGIIGNGVNVPSVPYLGGPALIFNDNMVSSAFTQLAVPAGASLSLSCWLRMASAAGDPFAAINFGVQTYKPLFSPHISAATSGLATSISLEAFTGSSPLVNTSTAISPAVWHHFVGVMSQPSQVATLYLDGVLVGTGSIGTQAAFDSLVVRLFYSFGGFSNSPVVSFDELGIWVSYALTAADVQTLWNSGTGARPPGV